MVEQTVPAVSVSALRERALVAAGVRGTFANLIDGKSVGARNSLDVLDPATGELLAKVPDIERDGMDAAFAAARRAFSSWSKLTWEARRAILEKALEKVKAGATVLDQPVVVDENVITSRFIYDIPQFVDAIVAQLN